MSLIVNIYVSFSNEAFEAVNLVLFFCTVVGGGGVEDILLNGSTDKKPHAHEKLQKCHDKGIISE